MNKDRICAFFGHRKINDKDRLEKILIELVENLIKDKGYSIFLFGGFGDFDKLCYEVVSNLKSKYSYIKRIYYLVDAKQLLKLKSSDKQVTSYEELIYPDLEFDYWYTRIYYRNCEMIRKSEFIIFYADKIENSGAYKAIKYARKIKKEYINIFE